MTGDTVNGTTRGDLCKSWMVRLVAHAPSRTIFTAFIISVPAFLTPFCPNTWKNCGRKTWRPNTVSELSFYALIELMRCLADPLVGPTGGRFESIG